MRKNRSASIKLIIYSILLSSVLDSFLLINFKKIRAIFPPPEIEANKLIGFAQYFGYPLYFDTIFFFFLIFTPVLTFIFLYFIFKNK